MGTALPTQVGIHGGQGQLPAVMDPDLRPESGRVVDLSQRGLSNVRSRRRSGQEIERFAWSIGVV